MKRKVTGRQAKNPERSVNRSAISLLHRSFFRVGTEDVPTLQAYVNYKSIHHADLVLELFQQVQHTFLSGQMHGADGDERTALIEIL